MFPSYRNQSVDLQSKSTGWFLYDGNIVIKELWSKLWLGSSRMKTHWKDFEYPLTIFVESSIKKHPPEVFYEKVVLKNFAKFTRKHLCQRCFPVNFNLKLLCTEKSDERKPLIQLLSFWSFSFLKLRKSALFTCIGQYVFRKLLLHLGDMLLFRNIPHFWNRNLKH